jgi:hypothetical protein
VTIQVLGPFNAADRVELLYTLASVRPRPHHIAHIAVLTESPRQDSTKTTYGTPIKASYRRARDGTPFIVRPAPPADCV